MNFRCRADSFWHIIQELYATDMILNWYFRSQQVLVMNQVINSCTFQFVDRRISELISSQQWNEWEKEGQRNTNYMHTLKEVVSWISFQHLIDYCSLVVILLYVHFHHHHFAGTLWSVVEDLDVMKPRSKLVCDLRKLKYLELWNQFQVHV